jgi:hypothetical protein
MAKKAEIKSYSLAEMKDKYIGKTGTADRDEYEYELRMDVLGRIVSGCFFQQFVNIVKCFEFCY